GAQMSKKPDQRFARSIEHRFDRNPLAVRIGDDADDVAQIQDPRLLRDVAGGKVLAEKALEIAAPGLADDLPRTVVFEPVDHDAVIAEEAAHEAGGVANEVVGIDRLV